MVEDNTIKMYMNAGTKSSATDILSDGTVELRERRQLPGVQHSPGATRRYDAACEQGDRRREPGHRR